MGCSMPHCSTTHNRSTWLHISVCDHFSFIRATLDVSCLLLFSCRYLVVYYIFMLECRSTESTYMSHPVYVRCNCMETHTWVDGIHASLWFVLLYMMSHKPMPVRVPPSPPCPWYVISMWDWGSLHICQVVKKQCGAAVHHFPLITAPTPNCPALTLCKHVHSWKPGEAVSKDFWGHPRSTEGNLSFVCERNLLCFHHVFFCSVRC